MLELSIAAALGNQSFKIKAIGLRAVVLVIQKEGRRCAHAPVRVGSDVPTGY